MSLEPWGRTDSRQRTPHITTLFLHPGSSPHDRDCSRQFGFERCGGGRELVGVWYSVQNVI